MEKIFVVAAAVMGFLGVGLGAFGSHALSAHFEANPDLEPIFRTATQYHMVHTLALLAVAWAVTHWSSALLPWAGYLFIAGVVIFSGSLYVLSLTGIRWLGAITPLGGVAFLAGWALLAVGVLRG